MDGTLVTRTTIEYNTYGDKIAETDALGAVTKYIYNHRENLIQAEDALGGISLFTYNYNDQKTVEVSPANYRPDKKLGEMALSPFILMMDSDGFSPKRQGWTVKLIPTIKQEIF